MKLSRTIGHVPRTKLIDFGGDLDVDTDPGIVNIIHYHYEIEQK